MFRVGSVAGRAARAGWRDSGVGVVGQDVNCLPCHQACVFLLYVLLDHPGPVARRRRYDDGESSDGIPAGGHQLNQTCLFRDGA